MAVSQYGTALLQRMQGVMLAACRSVQGGETALTPDNMRTLFNLSGSALAHQTLYAAQMSLPQRLAFADAREAYHKVLEGLGVAVDTEDGALLQTLLLTGGGDDVDRVVDAVVDHVQTHIDITDVAPAAPPSEPSRSNPHAEGSTSSRTTRATATPPPAPTLHPPLPSVASDEFDRVVYVDARAAAEEQVGALQEALRSSAPTPAELERLHPINKQRLLVEIQAHSPAVGAFASWLQHAVRASGALARLLDPAVVDGEVLLLGAHWIVSKVTQHDHATIPQQDFHADVNATGHVFSVAVHTRDEPMGTIVDPRGTVSVRSSAVGRADTPIFAYDTGVIHAGPGRAGVSGPYPYYDVGRVFFILASPELDPALVAKYRVDNDLYRMPARCQLAAAEQQPSPHTLAATCLRRVETRLRRQLLPREEKALFNALSEALRPLPSGDDANRLRLLTSPMLKALEEASGASLYACLMEVLRLSEGSAIQPTVADLCERLVNYSGAVAALGTQGMLDL